MKNRFSIAALLLLIFGWAYMSKSKIIEVGTKAVEGLKDLISGVPSELLVKMATAIMDWEDGKRDGILTAGSIAGENYNPGNLRYFANLDNMPWEGALGVDAHDHVVFENFDYGWNALIHQLTISFNGRSHNFNPAMNLFQFFAKYAEENSGNYARYVADQLEVSPELTLTQIMGAYA